MRNLLLTLRYDGTAFHGWQIQPNAVTVQEELCNAFRNLSGNDETVTAIFKMQSVGENIWNGGVYGIEASIITTVVLAIATVLIWFANRKRVTVK